MGISLTPQEKKVLGFVLFLFVFGLAVMGVKHWLGRTDSKPELPDAAPTNQAR